MIDLGNIGQDWTGLDRARLNTLERTDYDWIGLNMKISLDNCESHF